jgi:Tfp pilus assembly protein PilF
MDAGRSVPGNGNDTMGHGCLVSATLLAALLSGAGPDPIRTRTFDLDYAVNESALPLESVRLWYTVDGGSTWVDYGVDEDRHSPFTIEAPDEGELGLYLVMVNRTGASSAPPTKGTAPHECVFVDFTPPVVQLHPLRRSSSLGQALVQMRWTAIDAHLAPRPIDLLYQPRPDTTWMPMAEEPVANTGRFDWRPPDGMAGSIAVKIAVTDLGGNRVVSEPQLVETSATADTTPAATTGSRSPHSEDPPAIPGSKRAKERVSKLFAEAMTLRDRGEFAGGVSKLREVVKLDPKRTDAFTEMAGMLLKLGDADKSLHAYDLVLKQNPNDRAALRGTAMAYRELRDFPNAAERLRTILRYNPADAEAWMTLGDVAVFQGDEVLARDCYARATNIDPKAVTVIAEAQQRLALMASTSTSGQRKSK